MAAVCAVAVVGVAGAVAHDLCAVAEIFVVAACPPEALAVVLAVEAWPVDLAGRVGAEAGVDQSVVTRAEAVALAERFPVWEHCLIQLFHLSFVVFVLGLKASERLSSSIHRLCPFSTF